jgi:plasminogen activator inhibitor 1 RNA-binding protein
MRHGKRDGPDAPKPMPERLSHQNRAKQTDNANENGTLNKRAFNMLRLHKGNSMNTG